MPHWLWMMLLVILLVAIANYVSHGLIRLLFYILAIVVAIFTVVRLTGMG